MNQIMNTKFFEFGKIIGKKLLKILFIYNYTLIVKNKKIILYKNIGKANISFWNAHARGIHN